MKILHEFDPWTFQPKELVAAKEEHTWNKLAFLWIMMACNYNLTVLEVTW